MEYYGMTKKRRRAEKEREREKYVGREINKAHPRESIVFTPGEIQKTFTSRANENKLKFP